MNLSMKSLALAAFALASSSALAESAIPCAASAMRAVEGIEKENRAGTLYAKKISEVIYAQELSRSRSGVSKIRVSLEGQARHYEVKAKLTGQSHSPESEEFCTILSVRTLSE